MRHSNRTHLQFLGLTLVVVLALSLTTGSGCGGSGTSEPFVSRNVAVPMRDGVVLRADVRRPAKDGKYPVVVFRTPYSKDERDPDNEKTFREAVERGYAVVIQDVRGRYRSDGEFNPYVNEGKDGYDTIEWAASQPWSDGMVGTFGLSYPGAVQWLAALENPPHLKAAVPAMCFSNLNQFIYFGGVFESAWVNWAYRYMSPDTRAKENLPGPKTIDAATEEWKRLGGDDAMQGWLPSLEMPYLRDSETWYYGWLENGPYEEYWDYGDLRGRYGDVKAAVLNMSGWYDEPYGSTGAVTNYQGLLDSRKGEADPRTKLIIGPWIHGVDATGKPAAGDREFDSNAAIDYHDVVLDWLDRYVRGIDNGVPDWPDVCVYQMGSDRWLESNRWPLAGTGEKSLYLGPGGDDGKAGGLSAGQSAAAGSREFVSDPANPVKDEFGTNFGAFDLEGLSERSDVLTFETEPLTEDLEVMGGVTAELFVTCDAPDFDLYTKLLDVAPDGTAYNVESAGHEVLRASYRDRRPERELVQPGETVKLVFDDLITGNTFKKGHRIRLCITASWFPTYSRNLQTGLPETESAEMRKARITVLYGPGSGSRLVLSILKAGSK